MYEDLELLLNNSYCTYVQQGGDVKDVKMLSKLRPK